MYNEDNSFLKSSKIRLLIGNSIKNKQMKINATRETGTFVPSPLQYVNVAPGELLQQQNSPVLFSCGNKWLLQPSQQNRKLEKSVSTVKQITAYKHLSKWVYTY